MDYIHEEPDWPHFRWDPQRLEALLAAVRHRQGKLLGRMQGLGFQARGQTVLDTLTLDVLKSSEIEGDILNADQVRSSVARKLGIDIASALPSDRHVDGVVDMMLDATQGFDAPLTEDRLFGWHASLFPSGRSGMDKIRVGAWRGDEKGRMRVISGAMGKERVHFEAPPAAIVPEEMKTFLAWVNQSDKVDPVLMAAIAHLWFVTIHPFDDGNGRMARAIADWALARSEKSAERFYSMSSQIRLDRKAYYDVLEKTQAGSLDVTAWIEWFLACLDRAIARSEDVLSGVFQRARFWEHHSDTPFNERQRLMLTKILDGFDGKITSSKWAKITKCSQDTAHRDIHDLIEQGILIKEDGGGRSTSYVLKE